MPNIVVELAALADEPMMDPPGLNEDLAATAIWGTTA